MAKILACQFMDAAQNVHNPGLDVLCRTSDSPMIARF